MHREVQVISTNPVDRAPDQPFVQHEFDGVSAPTQVTQYEGEAEPTGQPPLILGGRSILEAVAHLCPGEPEAGDCVERQDELGVAGGVVDDIPRDPIPAERAGPLYNVKATGHVASLRKKLGIDS